MHWRQVQRSTLTTVEELYALLGLQAPASSFPLNLPLRLAQKIQGEDDPLFRQFVPTADEEIPTAGFCANPVGDEQARLSPRLLHKYQGRALLMPTSACAMHCRYCFRRHFDYASSLNDEIALIRQETSLKEIILSGGDPLSLSDNRLADLLFRLGEIPHLRRVRFHTRFPIGIPERIDTSFLDVLEKAPLQKWFVVHVNHPRELDADVLAALQRIAKLGIPVLNQSVLLKGVNDSIEVLVELCETLVDHGIEPYYLHQLDRVQGAAHFEVPQKKGEALMAELAKRLSGYALPRYVREEAGRPHKTVITSARPSATPRGGALSPGCVPSNHTKGAVKLALYSPPPDNL